MVRHWVLVPAFAGSNPAGPAIENIRLFGRVFSIVSTVGPTDTAYAIIKPTHNRKEKMDNTAPEINDNVAPAAPQPPAVPSSKKPTGLIVATAICSVLAVAGIAFGVYEFMGSNQKDSKISSLQSEVKEKDAKIEELENTISLLDMPTEETIVINENTDTETPSNQSNDTATVSLGTKLDDNGTRVVFKIGDCTADGPSVKCPVTVDGKEGLVSYNSNDSILRLSIPKE